MLLGDLKNGRGACLDRLDARGVVVVVGVTCFGVVLRCRSDLPAVGVVVLSGDGGRAAARFLLPDAPALSTVSSLASTLDSAAGFCLTSRLGREELGVLSCGSDRAARTW